MLNVGTNGDAGDAAALAVTGLLRATAASPTMYRNSYSPGSVGALSVDVPEVGPHRCVNQRSDARLSRPYCLGLRPGRSRSNPHPRCSPARLGPPRSESAGLRP